CWIAGSDRIQRVAIQIALIKIPGNGLTSNPGKAAHLWFGIPESHSIQLVEMRLPRLSARTDFRGPPCHLALVRPFIGRICIDNDRLLELVDGSERRPTWIARGAGTISPRIALDVYDVDVGHSERIQGIVRT